jgi:hypothetical protein
MGEPGAARATPDGGGRLSCLAVVPFLNESIYLGTFLASMDRQTRRPDQLVLVDDGSTDNSHEQALAYARTRPWVEVRARPPRTPGRDRLRDAPELEAFLWAVGETTDPFDVVVKMDADLRLAPRHFETVLTQFRRRDRLGMAGTFVAVMDDRGREHIERQPASHVRGASRFYRRKCFDDIAPIPRMLGWDGADEVRARARGWETRSFPLEGEQTIHLRPTGGHDGRLRAHARWGRCAYAVGAHPLGILAGAALRSRDRPWVVGGVAYAAGWAAGHLRAVERAPEDIRIAKREEQRVEIARVLRALPDHVRRGSLRG